METCLAITILLQNAYSRKHRIAFNYIRPFSKTQIKGQNDERLVGLQDIMPTLLNLCEIDVPESVEGISQK